MQSRKQSHCGRGGQVQQGWDLVLGLSLTLGRQTLTVLRGRELAQTNVSPVTGYWADLSFSWDPTPGHSGICARYLDLALHLSAGVGQEANPRQKLTHSPLVKDKARPGGKAVYKPGSPPPRSQLARVEQP